MVGHDSCSVAESIWTSSPHHCVSLGQLTVTLVFVLSYTLSGVWVTEAHPVAQGSLDLVIFRDHVSIRATVSSEEMFIAATFSGQKPVPVTEMMRLHAQYLLKHLYVSVDGGVLNGRVVNVPEQPSNRLTYEFEYRWSDSLPKHIGLRQDVLREFDFAPGNPWEASYFVRIRHDGQSVVEDRFLTFMEPVHFECSWQQVPNVPDSPKGDTTVIAIAFVRHGITHILRGYDHLLFLGALVLATVRLWDLFKVISVFSIAHTITLVLAVLDLFRLTASIVEPMIAASIVFVAVQNVFWPQQARGYSRLFVAFLFGLFHGLGFAGGLLDAMSTMQEGAAITAMIAFSFGVEVGHQVVVLPAFWVLRLLHRTTDRALQHGELVQRYGSGGIAFAGMGYLMAALR